MINRKLAIGLLMALIPMGCSGPARSYLERKQMEKNAPAERPEDARANLERDLNLYSD